MEHVTGISFSKTDNWTNDEANKPGKTLNIMYSFQVNVDFSKSLLLGISLMACHKPPTFFGTGFVRPLAAATPAPKMEAGAATLLIPSDALIYPSIWIFARQSPEMHSTCITGSLLVSHPSGSIFARLLL